jgi:hypothetical protein
MILTCGPLTASSPESREDTSTCLPSVTHIKPISFSTQSSPHPVSLEHDSHFDSSILDDKKDSIRSDQAVLVTPIPIQTCSSGCSARKSNHLAILHLFVDDYRSIKGAIKDLSWNLCARKLVERWLWSELSLHVPQMPNSRHEH